jgi:cell wall-associated NlpC family hydrolase
MSRTLLVLIVALSGACGVGCASTGAVPHPFPTPTPKAATPAPRPVAASADPEPAVAAAEPGLPEGLPMSPAIDGFLVAGRALQFRGTPYRLGGADPQDGFDCSGLVQYVYQEYGIAVPRDVRSQWQAGRKIRSDQIEPGDLLFFSTEGHDASHVAIAISSRQFVHAPNSNGVVRVEMLTSGYWSARYLGARRFIDVRQ